MSSSRLIKTKGNFRINANNVFKNLYKGACVKIKNSQKTFQVVGIDPINKICWIREWPFNLEGGDTFSLEINQITSQTFCSSRFEEKVIA